MWSIRLDSNSEELKPSLSLSLPILFQAKTIRYFGKKWSIFKADYKLPSSARSFGVKPMDIVLHLLLVDR